MSSVSVSCSRRNPLGINIFGLCSLSASVAEFEEAICRAHGIGFNFIELPLAFISEGGIGIDAVRGILDQLGLKCVCSVRLGPDADLCSDIDSVVEKGRRVLAEALRCSERLGAQMLVGAIHGQIVKRDHPVSARTRARVQELLGGLSTNARQRGITVCVEVLNRYESALFNTAEDALAFLDGMHNENVLVHLDSFHMNMEESDPARAIRAVLARDRLGYIQVADNDRGIPGTGSFDFDSVFDALCGGKYVGPVSVESFSSGMPDKRVAASVGAWRALWTDRFDYARQSYLYVDKAIGAAEYRASNLHS